MRARIRARSASPRATITTRAPAIAADIAVAMPIPLVAPVTTITCSANCFLRRITPPGGTMPRHRSTPERTKGRRGAASRALHVDRQMACARKRRQAVLPQASRARPVQPPAPSSSVRKSIYEMMNQDQLRKQKPWSQETAPKRQPASQQSMNLPLDEDLSS